MRSGNFRYSQILVGTFLLAILATLLSMNSGAVPLAWSGENGRILFSLRLPRIILCWMVGHLLALAGTFMQVLTRNPLGSPDILGIHAGASLCGILFLLFFPDMSTDWLPLFSFLGGLLFASIIFFFARIRRLSTINLALVGVALHILSSSLIQLVIHVKGMEIHSALAWLAGGLWGKSWEQVRPSLILFLPIMGAAYAGVFRLRVLLLQDEMIVGLGDRPDRLRFAYFILAAMSSGLSVALVGPIGFVALLAPQIGRMLAGPRLERSLPISSLAGTLLLLLADSLARGLAPPLEFPAGLLTPILGVPYFLYLLKRTGTVPTLLSESDHG